LSNIILTFDEKPGLVIMNGRFGPYIAYQKKNYKIPKGRKPEELTLSDCESLMADAPKGKGKTAWQKQDGKQRQNGKQKQNRGQGPCRQEQEPVTKNNSVSHGIDRFAATP
jgi:topoisomerase IA-like protein